MFQAESGPRYLDVLKKMARVIDCILCHTAGHVYLFISVVMNWITIQELLSCCRKPALHFRVYQILKVCVVCVCSSSSSGSSSGSGSGSGSGVLT